MFVTRLSFDFKIIHCEPKISELLDYTAEDITGKSMYSLCHGCDVEKIKKTHVDLLKKGQVMSHYYRLMNLRGGYTWMQTCATLVCNTKNSDEQSIICVNYVLSEPMGSLLQQDFQSKDFPSRAPTSTPLSDYPSRTPTSTPMSDYPSRTPEYPSRTPNSTPLSS